MGSPPPTNRRASADAQRVPLTIRNVQDRKKSHVVFLALAVWRDRPATVASIMTGGKFLAWEHGAFDVPAEPALVIREPEAPRATAPLLELAAHHDGQPADAWMRFFLSVWREYGDRV
jgi:hypothetical protein